MRCASPHAPAPEGAEGKTLFLPAPDQIIHLRHPLAGNGSVGGLFYRGAIPRGATRPFFTPPHDGGYLRSSHLGCAPHVELAPDVLRPLSGSAGPSVQPTPCDAGLNAAALLVSGGHPYSLAIPTYYDPLRLSPKRRSGVSRLVSGGLDVMHWIVHPTRQRSVADPDPWSCLPACEHSFERDLIPAYYTCRSCSPVGSEARTANSDFTNPPFPEPRLSAGTMFRIELATASTSSGLPTSATPHLALWERRWRAATRGAW